MKIKKEFDVATKARYTPEYTKLVGLRQRLHNKIKNSNGIEREKLIEEYKTATAQMLKLPAKQCDDKKIKYVRYADDCAPRRCVQVA